MKLILVLLFCLVGCIKTDKYNGLDIAEIESPEDQALAIVNKTPTSFQLEGVDNAHAWERASAFFTLYLDSKDSEKLKVTQELISNYPSKNAGYIYTITRRVQAGGYVYNVDCKLGKSYGEPSLAKRNARNLARFIQSSVLEVSLLAK